MLRKLTSQIRIRRAALGLLAGSLLVFSPACKRGDAPVPAGSNEAFGTGSSSSLLNSGAPRHSEHDYSAAIERTLGFLRSHADEVDPMVINLYGYLQRKFAVPALPRFDERLADLAAHPDKESPQSRVFHRVRDPEARAAAEDIQAMHENPKLGTLLALHCDREGLPSGFLQAIQDDVVTTRSCSSSTSLLAIQWALEGGCASEAEVNKVREAVAPVVVEFIERAHVARAAGLQAMAGLYYAGMGDHVRPEWIGKVLTAQLPDGGWSANPEDASLEAVSDPNVTVIGLWVLLEAMHPEGAHLPMIVMH